MTNEIEDRAVASFAELPGPNWRTPLEARTWLIEQRRLLGWSPKDVADAFLACAGQSDLYIGPGGGGLFDRPTEKRIIRFEREGGDVPRWLHWMPLAIMHAQVDVEDRFEWERVNIPGNSEVRRDREEDEEAAHVFRLDAEEIAFLQGLRRLDPDERSTLRAFADPNALRWWISCLKRAAARGTTPVELIEGALA